MPDTRQHLSVRGAREHNLQNVDLDLPRDALVTITGLSGSGKSSLAYHTIYQEGQRRFLESLSSYARQFLGRMEKPKVEHVEGLSPTVSIDQKSVGHSPRSTVGTLTELLDFLRLLYARIGEPSCPECGERIVAWSIDRIVERILATRGGQAVHVLAPVVRERKGHYRQDLLGWRAKGFVRARIDGAVRRLDEDIELARYEYHTIELVCDRLRVDSAEASRIADAVEQAVGLTGDVCAVLGENDAYEVFSTARACPSGHASLPELEPRLFSFNSPVGACPDCDGLGEVSAVSADLVVLDEEATIRDGALGGFTKEGKLLFGRLTLEHLEQVGDELGFDLDTPWRRLKKKARDVVLFGTGRQRFEFRWERGGRTFRAKGMDRAAWPGVVMHLEGVYRNSTARAIDRYRAVQPCPACEGTRLCDAARAVTFRGRALPELCADSVHDARAFFAALEMAGNEGVVGREIVREIDVRLQFLDEVGLGYLTLDRRANTLSGGESQRIRLAAQVGAGLRGILYVLDEPSIGLHHRDQERLLATLRALRDRGNSVIVVEHDEDTMRQSDFLVDVGPGAGREGGEIVAAGTPREVAESGSLTARYLTGEVRIALPAERRPADGETHGALWVRGARHHNLRDLDVRFPLGCLVAVTGVSGSGKSTLVNHVLKKALRRKLNRADDVPGKHRRIDGIEHLDKVVEIDQAPIGRTPRSNPATYTGVWDHVRDLFAMLPEARLREYKKGRFSFNVHGGRCEACQGAGVQALEMQFLAPVEVVCDDCGGSRFNPETLEIRYRDHSVADVLALTVDEAAELFAALPKIARGLETLKDVGLGYLQLGQPSTTLSGGEAQRVKLATELQRPATGKTMYLLDEPTTGLHFHDIDKLLACLQRLVAAGNSMIVIEHNLDVIKCADWIVDMGPGGGPFGGTVIAEGTPEQVAECADSPTGAALKPVLKPRKRALTAGRKAKRAPAPTEITIGGARKNNLRGVDVALPIDKFTVVTGVSGSGKSSLAFDTLFAEGQRRFIESLSTYARRFLGRLDRAPVDRLDGLGPAIAIDQKAASRSPRSTVATATEIQDYLRLLYARVGRPHCPTHGQELVRHPPHRIAREVLAELPGERGYVLAPIHLPHDLEGDAEKVAHYLDAVRAGWRERGFVRALVDGEEHRLEQPIPCGERWPELHLVVDRMVFDDRARLVDSAAQAAAEGGGRVVVKTASGETRWFSVTRSCEHCGHTAPENPHPRWFSFNHFSGACSRCAGLGRAIRCDPELLVNAPEKPLFRGAIRHRGAAFTFLTKPNGWFGKVAQGVAREIGFDLDAPFAELPAEAKAALLHGCGERRFAVKFRSSRRGRSRAWDMHAQWKGLCTQVEEWYAGQDPQYTGERFGAVMRDEVCPECAGARLGTAQRHVLVGGISLPALTAMTVGEAAQKLAKLRLRKNEREIAGEVLKEVANRLSFLDAVGLDYLTLDRSAATLSGGEAQRIRLATQLGNRLVGVLYVLDEPTIGLHPRDTVRLLKTLHGLRDLGNTVVAVEHDEAVMRAADWIVDLGPGAGHHGGRVVAAGSPAEVSKSDGLTGRYLRGELRIEPPAERREPRGTITLRNATAHNVRALDVAFPAGVLCAVTGVSGSGKSSLVMDCLLPALQAGKVELSAGLGGKRALRTVVVDQGPIGSTPASNPATYVEVMTPIRELFSRLPDARMKGFGPGRFSFNVPLGRCGACEGKGQVRVEMHFLADVWITCEVCRGKRYDHETLSVAYRNRSIADVLDMEAADAAALFGDHPRIARPLRLLCDVGLGYLRLGQAANTLSGGEAQRIKLVAQLQKRAQGHGVYLLDEPTTGLHLDDVAKLIAVLRRLVERGDSVIVIEHHLDVIRCADRVIELGPEAGERGGEIVVVGTPEEVAACEASATGAFLGLGATVRHRAGRRTAGAAAEQGQS